MFASASKTESQRSREQRVQLVRLATSATTQGTLLVDRDCSEWYNRVCRRDSLLRRSSRVEGRAIAHDEWTS